MLPARHSQGQTPSKHTSTRTRQMDKGRGKGESREGHWGCSHQTRQGTGTDGSASGERRHVGCSLGCAVGLFGVPRPSLTQVRLQTRPKGTYTGLTNCLSTVVKTEGVAALYRGLISPVLGYGLIKATAFASYNKAKNWTNQYNEQGGQAGQAAQRGTRRAVERSSLQRVTRLAAETHSNLSPSCSRLISLVSASLLPLISRSLSNLDWSRCFAQLVPCRCWS